MGIIFPDGIEILQNYFIEVVEHAVYKQLSAFLNFQLFKTKDHPDDEKTHMTIDILNTMNMLFYDKENFKNLDNNAKKTFESNKTDKCFICNDSTKIFIEKDTETAEKKDIDILDNINYQTNKKAIDSEYHNYVCNHKICKRCFLPDSFTIQLIGAGNTIGEKNEECLIFTHEKDQMDDSKIKIYTDKYKNKNALPIIDIYNCCPICNSAKLPSTKIPNILINNNYKPAAVTASGSSNQFIKNIFDNKYKIVNECSISGGRLSRKRHFLKNISRKQNAKKKNRSRKQRQHITRKKQNLRKIASKNKKKRVFLGGNNDNNDIAHLNNENKLQENRNMLNGMSTTINRIKTLYSKNKKVDDDKEKNYDNISYSTHTPYHDAVTILEVVYEGCSEMIKSFFGISDDGTTNPIVENVKYILKSCIEIYLQFYLEKCMEEQIGILLLVPQEEPKSRIQSNNVENSSTADSSRTTTHANVIKRQVEEILDKYAIDRSITLHKKINFKKSTK